MKTLNELLSRVMRADAALVGFRRPEDLPSAAKARVHMTMQSLERDFSHEELDSLDAWTLGSRWCDAEASFSEGECAYYIFADGSLYFRSSGDSEVWAFASDFASERILNGYEGPLDKMDYELLLHLGGDYAREAEERGKR